jgi:hypothetical protein
MRSWIIVYEKTALKYPELKARLVRKRISISKVAELIKCTDRTARAKLSGSSPLFMDEAKTIRDEWFPGMTLDDLYIEE